VQSQADTENADLARRRRALADEPERELAELTAIYMQRGLDELLARRVAATLMQHDALGAHSRDELGITEALRARSLQASMASATAFSAGGGADPGDSSPPPPCCRRSSRRRPWSRWRPRHRPPTPAVPLSRRGAGHLLGRSGDGLTAGVGRLFGATV
jgi:hypothetical protein